MFKTVVLKSGFSKFDVCSCSGMVSVNLFCFMNGPFFLFLCMSCDFAFVVIEN